MIVLKHRRRVGYVATRARRDNNLMYLFGILPPTNNTVRRSYVGTWHAPASICRNAKYDLIRALWHSRFPFRMPPQSSVPHESTFSNHATTLPWARPKATLPKMPQRAALPGTLRDFRSGFSFLVLALIWCACGTKMAYKVQTLAHTHTLNQ